MIRRSYHIAEQLTAAEKQFIRDLQPIYGFHIVINEIASEDQVKKNTVLMLQSETFKELTDNILILGTIMGEVFRGRGLSPFPKMLEKHYFSKSPEKSNPS